MISSDIFTDPSLYTRDVLSFCTTDVDGIRQWLEQLPTSQLGDTSKLLFNALIEISELNIEAEVKFNMMQVLHLPIEQVLVFFTQNVMDEIPFTSHHHENILDLIQQFRCYIIRIYSDVVLNIHLKTSDSKLPFCFAKKQRKFRKLRALSSYLALEQLSLLKRHQLTLYKESLMGQWQMTHTLFRSALKHKYHQINIKSCQPQFAHSQNNVTNIASLYKQITLLDILNTQQVRPNEIYALYQCSFEWVSYIQFSLKETLYTRYFIDLTVDAPPRLQQFHTQERHKLCIYMEINPLLQHINLANLPGDKNLSATEKKYLSPSLIFHLLNTLNYPSERRYQRYNFSSSIQITFGLDNACHYLTNSKAFKLVVKKNEKFDLLMTDQYQAVYTRPKELPRLYQCNILDISVNGYRMHWTKNTAPVGLHVEEFILVQENNQSPWRGGAIRWIKQLPNDQVEFGVEILSQELIPCRVTDDQSDQKTSNDYAALLIRKQDLLNEPSFSIIVPNSKIFQENKNIDVTLNAQAIKIYLTTAKLVNHGFAQFNFKVLNAEDQKILNSFISQYAKSRNNLDLWDGLK